MTSYCSRQYVLLLLINMIHINTGVLKHTEINHDDNNQPTGRGAAPYPMTYGAESTHSVNIYRTLLSVGSKK